MNFGNYTLVAAIMPPTGETPTLRMACARRRERAIDSRKHHAHAGSSSGWFLPGILSKSGEQLCLHTSTTRSLQRFNAILFHMYHSCVGHVDFDSLSLKDIEGLPLKKMCGQHDTHKNKNSVYEYIYIYKYTYYTLSPEFLSFSPRRKWC